MRFSVSTVLVLVVAVSCGGDAVSPDASAVAARIGAAASTGAVVESATGSAHRIRPLPDGDLWVLSFTAQKREDGTVTGHAHVDRKDLDAAWDVEVTCLSVVGNTAWIGGIIRNARGALPVNGTVSYFYVIDNGEGGNSPPDRASAVRINDAAGEDIEFCTLRPLLLANTEIAHGNVQVR
jgi:hypothetical protein